MPCASCTPHLLPDGVACARCAAAPSPSGTEAALVREAALVGEAALFQHVIGADRSLQGLGGWLIPVGIRLVLAPLVVLQTIFASNLSLLSNQSYQPYFDRHPMLHGLILLELATNICVLAILAALLYLFFQKKRAFPTYAILYMVFYTVVMAADAAAIHYALPASPESGLKDLFSSAATAAIWIPYFLLSRRVKATFIH